MANSSELNDIAQLLPTIFIEQITLDSVTNKEQTNKNLLVSISLSLKDVVEKDDISEWFSDQDLQKYIKAHCLLIKDKGLYNNFFNFTDDFTYEDLKSVIDLLSGGSIIEKVLVLPTEKELINTKNTTYSENYITENDDGTKNITVPLNVKYETPFDQENNKFLGLLCFLTFDLKAFASNFKIDDISEQNALSKSLTAQIIIDNGEIVSETQYFLKPDGSFYYGQFHVEIIEGQKVYKTGVVETDSSIVLELVTDKNNIVCDYRTRKYFADKEVFDSTGIENNVLKSDLQIKKLLEKTKNKSKEFSKYFSDTLISLDEQGNCRFSFFFDKMKFALDNSFYPIALEPTKNPLAVPQDVKIKNIRIYRIRKDIKEINSSSENLPVLIAENSTDLNSSIDVLKAPDLLLFNGSYIAENNVEGIENSILKHYSVCDTYVSKINYGLYKYQVSMEIVDPTKAYLENILIKLTGLENSILPTIEEYYNLSLSNKKIKEKITGDAKINKVKYVPYFDVLLGKFTADFSKDNIEKINNAQNQVYNFLTLARNLGYYSFNDVEEENKFLDSFNKLVIPPSATPDSIKIVIEVIKDFVNKVQELVGTKSSQTPAKVSSKYKNNIISFDYIFENSSTENIANTTEYDISKSYENYFNAAIINGVGYKVVNNTSNLNLGFNAVSLTDYKNITDLVSKKYFEDYTTLNLKELYGDTLSSAYNFVDEFNNDDSKYCFLPVTSIGTINKKYNFSKLSEQFFDQEYYQNIFLDILNYNTLKQSNFSNQDIIQKSSISNKQQIIKGQLLELFSDPNFANISLSSEETKNSFESSNDRQSLYNLLGAAGSFDRNKIDPQISARKNTSKASSSEVDNEPNSLLLEILLNEIVNNSFDLNNAKDYSFFCPLNENGQKNNNFFMDKIAALAILASFIPNSPKPEVIIQNYIRALPIPIKLLLISRGNIFGIVKAFEDLNNIKDATVYVENFFKYWINFKKMYQIEYFDGFQNNNLKSPVWKTLTIDKLNLSESKILCRIQKYKLDGFEEFYPDIPKLELPLFDKFFYIIPDNGISLLSSIQKSIQKFPLPKVPINLRLENPPPDRIGPISMIDMKARNAEAAFTARNAPSTQPLNIVAALPFIPQMFSSPEPRLISNNRTDSRNTETKITVQNVETRNVETPSRVTEPNSQTIGRETVEIITRQPLTLNDLSRLAKTPQTSDPKISQRSAKSFKR